jgi:hypothetical protein
LGARILLRKARLDEDLIPREDIVGCDGAVGVRVSDIELGAREIELNVLGDEAGLLDSPVAVVDGNGSAAVLAALEHVHDGRHVTQGDGRQPCRCVDTARKAAPGVAYPGPRRSSIRRLDLPRGGGEPPLR